MTLENHTALAMLAATVLATAAVVLLLLGHARGHVLAQHWLNQKTYKDPVTKQLCCYHQHNNSSFNHCHEMVDEPKRNKDGSYTLQTGEVVPAARVQWSKDYNYYECRNDSGELLCFFAVPDGN